MVISRQVVLVNCWEEILPRFSLYLYEMGFIGSCKCSRINEKIWMSRGPVKRMWFYPKHLSPHDRMRERRSLIFSIYIPLRGINISSHTKILGNVAEKSFFEVFLARERIDKHLWEECSLGRTQDVIFCPIFYLFLWEECVFAAWARFSYVLQDISPVNKKIAGMPHLWAGFKAFMETDAGCAWTLARAVLWCHDV